ncbi:hypothetical protein [Microbacterium sp.]|uniref:hypothetical protein n=1 Tax=Microbacterium sp. TaxID=51671 RepID=UPI0039E24E06
MVVTRPAVRTLVAAAVISIAVGVAGCAAAVAPANTAYAADFEDARVRATSQFEHDVLADGKITRAEYEEAMQRFVACANDNAVDVSLIEQAGYFVYSVTAASSDSDAVMAACQVGNNQFIEPLFVDQLMNPDKKDIDEVIAHCFVAMKVVPPPFSKADLQRLFRSAGIVTYAVTGSSAAPLDATGVEVDEAAKAILDSPDASNCQANPSYDLLVSGDGG